MQDHVLRPRHAFDFGDEVTIGGRDAVSSSSAFVSDRLGSLSYHKPDHPTLNAAAALGPTSTPPTAVLLRGHRACRRGDLSADPATSPYYGTDRNRAMGEVLRAAVLLVRLATPVPRFHRGTRGGYKNARAAHVASRVWSLLSPLSALAPCISRVCIVHTTLSSRV